MLDNAVAGGIASGESPFESLVRECGEEASLDEEFVRSSARACGTVTYWYIRDERAGGETNLMQPEVQYVYDLELPEDTIPKPGDDEVEEFYLWGVEEVQEAMRRGEFKPNCALVVLDFLVRHGILTTENERDYIEIVSRLHRKLEFPTL
jgi:8-oxo-dGTP pyrophosphatase MutT (NUDIX family)